MRLIYVLPLLLALQSAQAADCNLQRGKVLFESKCAMCHSAQQGEAHSVGPNLFGVVGRLKGRAQAFDYSEAMQKTGGSWTPEQLELFLRMPQQAVPGTAMPFQGMKVDADRKALVCQLEPLK